MKKTISLLLCIIAIQTIIAQVTPEWSLTNGTTSNDAIDFPTSSVSDNSGNTYISGFSTYNEANGGHYLFLKKIDSNGQLAWEKEYDIQQSFSGDSYSKITLDNQQNIIVTAPDLYNIGLFIAKVSPIGNVNWSDTINSTINYVLNKVITDSNNNIYVGASNGDFNLIKYNQDGILQFNLSIDGGLMINDVMKNISLDDNDNIVFSGNRGNIPGENSAIVFKYDASGNQLWSTIIAQTNISQIEINDHTLINNEIIVCGVYYSDASNYRGYLAKLNTSGTQGPLSVDPQPSSSYYNVATLGNELVVVVGEAQGFGSVNTSLKKFNASLSEIWNEVLSSGGRSFQLLTLQNTNIFILTEHGSSTNVRNTIYNFNDNGNLIWSLENDSSTYLTRSEFISISSNNTVRLTSPYFSMNNSPYNDYTNIKVFDINIISGVVNWTFQYDGITFSGDRATLMTNDSEGNLYVAGSFSAGYQNLAVGIVKYNNSGNLLWIKKLDFSAGNSKDDEPLSIVCDAQNNLIVGGYTTAANKDFLLIKLNADGDLLWQKTFNGTGNDIDKFTSVVIDASSNIYAAGLSVRNFGNNNNFYVHQVYKYDPNGIELWENWDYSNPTGNQKIMLSPSQQMVYLGCEYYGNTTNPSDLGVFKLRADNGSYLHWSSLSGTSNNSIDRIKGLAIDSLENIYLNGNINNAGLKTVVIKYDSTLTQVWSNVYANNSIGNQFFQDRNQNMLVTMSSMSSDSAAIIKYNTNGSIIWTKKLINNNNNLSNTLIRQLNDTTYVAVSMLNSDGGVFLNKVFVIDTSGNVLNTYTTSNESSYYLRDIQIIDNALYTCGFYNEDYNYYIFHEDYYVNKYQIGFQDLENQPPSVSSIQNEVICNNASPLQIPFTVNDENLSQVTISILSSNELVIPNNSISVNGSGTDKILNISLNGSSEGQTTITINVEDDEGLITSSSFLLVVEVCTKILTEIEEPFHVYPNPTSGLFKISGINDNIGLVNVSVRNIMGETVYSFSNFNSNEMINIGDSAPGIYLVEVKSNNAIATFKVLKQ